MCKNTTENNPVTAKSSRFRLLSSVSSVNQNKRSNVKRKRDDDSAPDKNSAPDKISSADKKKRTRARTKRRMKIIFFQKSKTMMTKKPKTMKI